MSLAAHAPAACFVVLTWWTGGLLQETQTKPEGQIHFFPVIFNGREVGSLRVFSLETKTPDRFFYHQNKND